MDPHAGQNLAVKLDENVTVFLKEHQEANRHRHRHPTPIRLPSRDNPRFVAWTAGTHFPHYGSYHISQILVERPCCKEQSLACHIHGPLHDTLAHGC